MAVPVATAAQSAVTKVFEWRDASGTRSFSQFAPPPGTRGVKVSKIKTAKLTPAQQLAVKVHLAQLSADAHADAVRLRDRTAAADRKVDLASQRLEAAELAVRAARTPAPGERVGNANGSSRLRATFFERQQDAETWMDEAKKNLEDAYRLRAQLAP